MVFIRCLSSEKLPHGPLTLAYVGSTFKHCEGKVCKRVFYTMTSKKKETQAVIITLIPVGLLILTVVLFRLYYYTYHLALYSNNKKYRTTNKDGIVNFIILFSVDHVNCLKLSQMLSFLCFLFTIKTVSH